MPDQAIIGSLFDTGKWVGRYHGQVWSNSNVPRGFGLLWKTMRCFSGGKDERISEARARTQNPGMDGR